MNCAHSKYTRALSGLHEAQIACSSSKGCSGVYDVSCNGRAPFYMCTKTPKGGYTSSKTSCIYARHSQRSTHRECSLVFVLFVLLQILSKVNAMPHNRCHSSIPPHVYTISACTTGWLPVHVVNYSCVVVCVRACVYNCAVVPNKNYTTSFQCSGLARARARMQKYCRILSFSIL